MKSPLIVRLLQALLRDVARLEPDVKGLDRDFVTIQARFEHEGVGFLSVALASLCDAVDYGLATKRFTCPTGFRKSRSGALPRLFSGLLCKVFDLRTGSLKEDPCLRAVKNLRQILRFFKKFVPDTSRETTLHDDAVRTFWDAELRCSESFNPLYSSLLSRVAGYTLSGLSLFRPDQIIPKHGPGAVRERLAPNQKWSEAFESLNTDSAYDRYALDLFRSANRTSEELLLDYSSGVTGRMFKIGNRSFLSHGLSPRGCARLVSVPKNSSARRTITVEPLLNMFIQQGLNTELRSQIEKCSVLKNCLALTDQSYNQYLALEGSRTGEWSTIDLSSASDLLSYELVKLVFGRHTEFSFCMDQCRTEFVERDKLPQRLAKFAGMGNALTFPVQSCVFALLAICAILYSEGYSAPSVRDVRRTSRVVRVFGDDIIVPSRYSRQVNQWIESFGLKVNQKKSFMEGNFRESCGLDSFMGVDVTPIYYRVDPLNSPVDAETLGSWVSTSNQLWDVALYSTSDVLRGAVEEAFKPLPLVSRESGALGWFTRGGSSSFQRWNRDLHYLEVRAPRLVPSYQLDRLGGEPALFKFFLTPLIQRDKDHLKRSTKRFSSRIAWRWMPAQAGTSYLDPIQALEAKMRKDQFGGSNPYANLLEKPNLT